MLSKVNIESLLLYFILYYFFILLYID